jgi:hypothetical protein
MQLSPIVDGISEDLRRAGAVGGDETRRVAEVLVASVESSVRLHLLDALHEAAHELSESAPGWRVEVRLEGRDPVLSLVSEEGTAEATDRIDTDRLAGYLDDELARLTLRLPEGLKGQVEGVASRHGASINSWIVQALAHALDQSTVQQASRRMPRRMTGYVRG